MTNRMDHWEGVHNRKGDDEVSWTQSSPEPSLSLMAREPLAGLSVVDVGGGASRLVDALMAAGANPTVLDLSNAALERARARLGETAEKATWIVADITKWQPSQSYSLWHDRAVYHFLTEPEDRAAYRETLASALKPGGWAIIATFAPDGPEKCSGLPVRRASPDILAEDFDGLLSLEHSCLHTHAPPWGAKQKFQFSVFRRI